MNYEKRILDTIKDDLIKSKNKCSEGSLLVLKDNKKIEFEKLEKIKYKNQKLEEVITDERDSYKNRVSELEEQLNTLKQAVIKLAVFIDDSKFM